MVSHAYMNKHLKIFYLIKQIVFPDLDILKSGLRVRLPWNYLPLLVFLLSFSFSCSYCHPALSCFLPRIPAYLPFFISSFLIFLSLFYRCLSSFLHSIPPYLLFIIPSLPPLSVRSFVLSLDFHLFTFFLSFSPWPFDLRPDLSPPPHLPRSLFLPLSFFLSVLDARLSHFNCIFHLFNQRVFIFFLFFVFIFPITFSHLWSFS